MRLLRFIYGMTMMLLVIFFAIPVLLAAVLVRHVWEKTK